MAATAGAALVACSNDQDVLRDVSIDANPTLNTATATTAASETTATPTTSITAPVESTAETTPTTAPPVASTAFAAGSEMVIGFTYAPTAEGKDEPPYTAVWVENADGLLVHTISLWRQQNEKGLKYLRTLRRWFTVDQNRIADGGVDLVDVMSSPTRFAGTYSVAWDGTSDVIEQFEPGDYFICIETSREDGPVSLIREPIRLDAQPIELALPDDTELVSASVSIA